MATSCGEPIKRHTVPVASASPCRVQQRSDVRCQRSADGISGIIVWTRSKCLCLDSHFWPCVEVSGKFFIPSGLCIPRKDVYLVECKIVTVFQWLKPAIALTSVLYFQERSEIVQTDVDILKHQTSNLYPTH